MISIFCVCVRSPSRYFEQRLRAAEDGYREEIALLQLRLVEGALEESLIKTGDARYANGQAQGLIQSRQLIERFPSLQVVCMSADCLRLCF